MGEKKEQNRAGKGRQEPLKLESRGWLPYYKMITVGLNVGGRERHTARRDTGGESSGQWAYLGCRQSHSPGRMEGPSSLFTFQVALQAIWL